MAPSRMNRHHKPDCCQAKTVCVPLVNINGPSYRLKDRLTLVSGGDNLQ
jgi:hypothetical protein